MEFSWNYEDTMRRFSCDSRSFSNSTDAGIKQASAYSAILEFNLAGDTFEVLSSIDKEYIRRLSELANGESFKLVIPLYSNYNYRQISGAETMIKYFSRAYDNARVHKVITPKNEVYYGNNGIILDSNFNPLVIITKTLEKQSQGTINTVGFTVHVHPSVFIDDDKVLNKSLAKKGMAYYLTHNSRNSHDYWGPRTVLPYKVITDDCSAFFKHPIKPDVATFTKETTKEVLREHIDEILTQVSYDSRDI